MESNQIPGNDSKTNNASFTLSADGLTLLKVTNAAIDENGHFTIPDSVTSIGDYAFRYCTSLTTVHIRKGVTSIGYQAFDSCTSLTKVDIPDSVTSIEDEAFYGCISLTKVHIRKGVTSI